MVEAYMGSDIVFEPLKGERFSLAGGNITGEFLELVGEDVLLVIIIIFHMFVYGTDDDRP